MKLTTIKVLLAAAAALGAAQVQAQTLYNVTYSQSFSGIVFGNPTSALVQGTFTAIDAAGAGSGVITAAEISQPTFSLNLSGGVGVESYSSVNISSLDFVWVVGDTNLTNALSNVGFVLNKSGGVLQWYAGVAQGFTAPPLGELSLLNPGNTPVVGFFPANATGPATFTAVAAPIPEPGTYLMMLAGIAGVAAVVRRRKA